MMEDSVPVPENSDSRGLGSVEVAVVPEDRRCPDVRDIHKAELAPGGALLACLEAGGRLLLLHLAAREAPPPAAAAAAGRFTDFRWDETGTPGGGGRLVAVGSGWDLKLLEAVLQPDSSLSLQCVFEVPAEHLLHTPSVCEPWSVQLLAVEAGRCLILLDTEWLLQLQWRQEEQQEMRVQPVSSCRLQPADGTTAVHQCLCRNTLFILRASGLISVHAIADGRLLASVDLPSYLDQPSSSPSSFCLLQVTSDLGTAVAVTRSHLAVAVDLNDYFRTFPGHLHCPPQPGDQDSLSSSSGSLAFSSDRSWEARLTAMYNRAQRLPSPPPALRPPWWSSLSYLDSRSAPSSACSRVPPSGAATTFSVPEAAVPSQLAVSNFSVLLVCVAPSNRQTTVVLWDLESQSVSYHQAEGEAAPVQCCGEPQHRFLLRRTGLFQVLFGVSQQELLSRLMLFGSAATVDAVCHLNSWGRCSIPIHALQGGLKNRQLDTVDFYLKSKENVLAPPSLSSGLQDLCPALDLLCAAVSESNSEAQSRQFSEQLLNVTLSFVYTQIRGVLSASHHNDCGVQSCLDILDHYVTRLRSYMKRFPWPAMAGNTATKETPQEAAPAEEWNQLPVEEVVRRSILTCQIPRAQAALRRRGRPQRLLAALRAEGLRQVFCCLQHRDLQTANTLLSNMGFSVKMQLHRICLYTDDKDLRNLMVEELSRRRCLPTHEMQSVDFIREMERLGSLPAPRGGADTSSQRVPGMRRADGGEEDLLKHIIEGSRPGHRGLWTDLRLDWVKNWDQDSWTAVSLSRRPLTERTSCDPSVLWRDLTSLHDQRGVVEWIQDAEAPSPHLWPDFSPELVQDGTVCSPYLTDTILDLLSRRGLFIPAELADLERLLWRLAQGGGLMATPPPVPRYRSAQGLDLHGALVSSCLKQDLQYLLYCYLQHYRLTPRNCPLLRDSSLPDTPPWLDMLVRIQEITRDLSDPGLLFQASLTSAQVLLPGSQASLSSLLLEGHSPLALAAIMFSPAGVDQVMAQGQSSGRADRAVDPQLLKMALATHPKLKAALFPSGPRGTGTSSDVSIYHLLQSLHPLDPSRLFGWQAANTLNSTETAELPHFSSPHLVSRFALVENLDFLFYLRHGRPSSAYATFLVQQLGSGGDVTLLLQQASRQVYRLALQCFSLPAVTSATVCFCQLIGLSSLKLRVDVRVLNAVWQHWNHRDTHTTAAGRLHTLGFKAVKLAEAELEAAEELKAELEAAVSESLELKGVSRSSYEAAQEWVLPVQFCRLHGANLSSMYLAHCAEDRNFIHFLLFVQLHNFPPKQVRSLLAGFQPTLQAHLSLAFQDLQVSCQSSSQDSKEQPGSSGARPECRGELFQVLLQSQEEPEPCSFFLQEALLQHCPALAVLAACLQGAEGLRCLCVWLLTSVDRNTAAEAVAQLPEAPEHHQWTLHHLSIIWRTLLGRGHVQPLLQGFQLFLRDCPLVLVLRMFELCCDYRNFADAKSKLLDFQRNLVALRTGGPASEGGLPLRWLESQASVLLLVMLRRCSFQYDLHRLLQLLADVDKLLKSNGPDFRKLSRLSGLLRGSEVGLSPRLLHCSSASVQREELQAAVDALQARGLYAKARQVALLAGLSVQDLLLSQLHQEASSQRSRRQWGSLETRVCFWRRCHQQLKADGAQPAAASHFFLSQAHAAPQPPDLLDLQECCLLFAAAAHWLSLLSPVPLERLESLEKELWVSRVREGILRATLDQESVFSLPPDTGSYQVLLKDFSFSAVPDLNGDQFLSLEGLPGPGPSPRSTLTPEESTVLATLVGGLLDEGSVHEASRVCRYFSLHHPDLQVVLRCRGLASGDLDPGPSEEAETSMSSSRSSSSLSSLVALPEDRVEAQLHGLLDQCLHGNNYCKQVLGLYQLSKELRCSFGQVSGQEPRALLERLLQSERPDRFRKARAFIAAQGLGAHAVARLLASSLLRGLLGSAREPPPGESPCDTPPRAREPPPEEKPLFRPWEGRDSLLQLVRVCGEPSLVGAELLENLHTIPLRELSCMVELLVVAHDCFSLSCNMEGIVRVLQAARHLSHTHLSPGEHHRLLVRLLTGIGRYNEMTYVFDLLHQNHCFEMLLRKKVDSERGQSSSLKTALLDYIKRCLPADSEKHNMVALCFSMRREIGENHEMAARTQLKIIQSQAWVVTPDLKSSLVKVLNLLKDAAESFSKDCCVRQASRCVRAAKLVTLQLHFLDRGSELRVINLRRSELPDTVLAVPRCYQVFVVCDAYSYSPDWAQVLVQKVVLDGDFSYLEDFKRYRPLNTALFQDIFTKLDGAPSSVAPNVKRLLSHCDDVFCRYRLAYQQKLFDVTKTLLQDSNSSSYLNDRLAC